MTTPPPAASADATPTPETRHSTSSVSDNSCSASANFFEDSSTHRHRQKKQRIGATNSVGAASTAETSTATSIFQIAFTLLSLATRLTSKYYWYWCNPNSPMGNDVLDFIRFVIINTLCFGIQWTYCFVQFLIAFTQHLPFVSIILWWPKFFVFLWLDPGGRSLSSILFDPRFRGRDNSKVKLPKSARPNRLTRRTERNKSIRKLHRLTTLQYRTSKTKKIYPVHSRLHSILSYTTQGAYANLGRIEDHTIDARKAIDYASCPLHFKNPLGLVTLYHYCAGWIPKDLPNTIVVRFLALSAIFISFMTVVCTRLCRLAWIKIVSEFNEEQDSILEGTLFERTDSNEDNTTRETIATKGKFHSSQKPSSTPWYKSFTFLIKIVSEFNEEQDSILEGTLFERTDSNEDNTTRETIAPTATEKFHSSQKPSSTPRYKSFTFLSSTYLFIVKIVICSIFIQCVEAANPAAIHSSSLGKVAVVTPVAAGAALSALVVKQRRERRKIDDNCSTPNTKRQRSNSNNDNASSQAIKFMESCGASSKLLECAKSSVTSPNQTNLISSIIIKLLELLGDNIGDEDLRTRFHELKVQLHDGIIDKAEEYKGRLNFGDCLSVNTALLILKHYAPISCKGKACNGFSNLIWRSNVCILQFLKVLPRSLHKEGGGGEWTDDHVNEVDKHVSFLDKNILVPEKKKDNDKEFRTFASRLGTTKGHLELITFIFYCIHIKHYKLVSGNNDSVLTVMCASMETFTQWFDKCEPFHNDSVLFGGNVPHGEVIASRKIRNPMNYPDDVLKSISDTLLLAYRAVAKKSLLLCMPNSSEIAERFAGNMTPEEREALLESIIESCRKGGRISGKMGTDAATLVRLLQEEGHIKSKEDAFEFLEMFLSVEHANRYKGCVEGGKMGTDAATLVRLLQEEGHIKSKKDAFEFLEMFLSVEHANRYKGCVEGGEKGGEKGGETSGKMATDAATLVQDLMNEGVIESKQEGLAWIESILSKEHASKYKGSLDGGCKGAPLPPPPKPCRTAGKFTVEEKELVTKACKLLGHIDISPTGICTFLPTRDNEQVRNYFKSMKENRNDEYTALEEEVKAFQHTKISLDQASATGTGGHVIERQIPITYLMGDQLGAKVTHIRKERVYKVTEVTSSVSKLQVGDAILYVNGKYSVHMEMKEFTASLASNVKRMVLVSRSYVFPAS